MPVPLVSPFAPCNETLVRSRVTFHPSSSMRKLCERAVLLFQTRAGTRENNVAPPNVANL